MRGTSLVNLVEQLKSEVGQSVLTTAGLDDLSALKNCIRGVQEDLYDSYDWPHMQVTDTVAMVAGTFRYDVPSLLNYERVEEAKLYYNGQFRDVEYGIGFAEYNLFNSLKSPTPDKSDPALKWDLRSVSGALKIEVWPVPATSSVATLYLSGIRKLAALTADSDTCDIDGRLIVLTAALPILADQESPRLGVVKEMAARRLGIVKGRVRKSGDFVLRGDLQRAGSYRGQTIIQVS